VIGPNGWLQVVLIKSSKREKINYNTSKLLLQMYLKTEDVGK